MKRILLFVIAMIMVFSISAVHAENSDNAIMADVIIEKMEDLDVENLQRIVSAGEALIKKKQDMNNQDTDYLGIWSEKYFVDNFGDPTDERYIVATVDGVFSNIVATNSSLKVKIMVYVEKDKPRMRIELYEYGSSKVKIGGTEEKKYYFSVKDDNSEVHKFTFRMYENSDKLYAYYEWSEYTTGEFRVDADFVEMLKNNKTLKFVVTDDDKYGKSTYKFNIDDTTGFSNALSWLLENVHVPDEAELAATPPTSFTYKTYEVPEIHLSFDAPEDWIIDKCEPGEFVLVSSKAYEGYTPRISIRTEETDRSFNQYVTGKEVESRIVKYGEDGYKDFSYSRVYDEKFIAYGAQYTNYQGVTNDDAQVAGRLIIICKDHVLYIMDFSCPNKHSRLYKNVYDTVRKTAKIIQ